MKYKSESYFQNVLLYASLIPIIFLFLISNNTLFSQEPVLRNRETNPNYQDGDWISYSVAKFITSIALGNQYVYFGTRHSGITRIDQFQKRWDFPWTTSNGLADNEIMVVAFDFDTGFLWCASRTALSYYQPSARKWRNFFKDEIGIPLFDDVESVGIDQDRILFETRGGRIFEGSKFGGGILLADRRGIGQFPSSEIRWFGKRAPQKTNLPHFFMNDGYIFDPTGIVEDSNFKRAEVVAAVEDDWGNLWIGTWGLGAGKGDIRSLQLEMLNFGLANPSVTSLTFHADVLWMAGHPRNNLNRGITSWDLDRDFWTTYEQRNISDLLSDQINSITLDGDNIWFSTNYGLTRYSTKKNRWKTYDRTDDLSDNIVMDTVVDDSSVWVATINGIGRIVKSNLDKKDSLKIEQINPGHLTLVQVNDLELMENLLWAGTSEGIYVYDSKKKTGGFADEIGGPTSQYINSISRYKDELWFGSREGIAVFDVKKRQWLGVPEGRAFPNTSINDILASKEAVWAATNRGVLKFNRKSRSWRTFTTEDGLIDNHVNDILLDGDYVWFGTERGITQFYWNDPGRID